MYIVVKYKIHLYSLRNRPEKLVEGSLFCLFLKLVQINFIFTDNVRILYMCPQSPSILIIIYNKEIKQSHMILLSQQETKDHVE
jgi:hypothetical protein